MGYRTRSSLTRLFSTMDSDWVGVQDFVGQSMTRWRVPGAAVGILHNGETASDGFGVTSIENPLPVTDETVFRLGSISKTFVGTAFMRLVERGKLNLFGRARDYLPEFKVADEQTSAAVTMQHLLTHTAGWDGDLCLDAMGTGDDALPRYVAALADREQIAPLGTVFGYNNSGFGVVGAAMENVTNKRFEEIIRELVLDPLGMKRSFVSATDVMNHRFAVGHAIGPNGLEVEDQWGISRARLPQGGIASTVKDMLRYARFHLGDGETVKGQRLLTSESMMLLHRPQVGVYGKEGWGISFRVNDTFGPRQFGHCGRSPNQNSLLTIVPDLDFAIIVLTNADHGQQVVEEVTRFAIKQYLGIAMTYPDVVAAAEKDFADFIGKYTAPSAYMEIGILAGQLLMQYVATPGGSRPAFPLGLLGKDRIVVTDGPLKDIGVFDLVRKADGTVGWIRVMMRIYRKV